MRKRFNQYQFNYQRNGEQASSLVCITAKNLREAMKQLIVLMVEDRGQLQDLEERALEGVNHG